MIGIYSDADIQHNAFAKGIREVDQRNDRTESINIRRELSLIHISEPTRH